MSGPVPTAPGALDEIISHCIHCGMCLPVCPTYALTLREQSSPRGRIRLMRSVRENNLGVTPEFVREMNFCLDCQACQTACPAGVQYGPLVEDARRIISEQRKEPFLQRLAKWSILRGVLSSRRRTNLAARIFTAYAHSGLRERVERSGFLGKHSPSLARKQRMLPPGVGRPFDEEAGELLTPPLPIRGRVALLTGCVMNVAFQQVHRDTADVLLRNGFEVLIPRGQGCCGSLHSHHGYTREARRLARRLVDRLKPDAFDALVVNSAGCAAFLKEYGSVLADDPVYGRRAGALAAKTKEITEFLVGSGFEKPGWPIRKRVTYHEACHLVHTQKISVQPREVIRSIPGIDFVELAESTWCCGSAGIYNVTQFDESMKLLDRKMSNLSGTAADIVLTANPGCHLQIAFGLRELGLTTEVMHPVSLLARAYG